MHKITHTISRTVIIIRLCDQYNYFYKNKYPDQVIRQLSLLLLQIELLGFAQFYFLTIKNDFTFFSPYSIILQHTLSVIALHNRPFFCSFYFCVRYSTILLPRVRVPL